MKAAMRIKTPPFSMTELEQVLKDIKTGKARDPEGLARDIFKQSVLGTDLKLSLLTMCNKIKEEGTLPDYMRKSVIATIPKKGRLSQNDLTSERGIFLVSTLRSICMRLAYNSKKDMIDSNMSQSNIGGRKNKSCRNHIWVLNAIVHDQLSSVHKNPIIFQQYDYKQMFDGINLKEAINDLFDVGVKDNTLQLVYDANKTVQFRVKTPVGMTEEGSLEEVVLQGDTWAPVAASVQVDGFGKELLEEEAPFIYRYKNYIPIGILGQVDDLIGVAEAGFKSHQLNSYINVKTSDKYLQFGKDKCQTMVISKQKEVEKYLHSELEVDTWKVTFDKNENMKETFDGKQIMKEVKEIKYLGVVISQDGSNMPDIIQKRNKSLGTHKLIMKLVKGLGNYTFECGFIYLRSILRGSILYATEVMYNLNEKEKRTLERIEEQQMRQFFDTEKGCPLHIMYLDGGLVPARYIIMGNMAIFLQYILQENNDSILWQMLQAQIQHPLKKDWNTEVKSVLKKLNIIHSYEEIKIMKKLAFKKLVRQKVEELAFLELTGRQKAGSKGCQINYGEKFEMADYLMPSANIKLEDQIDIFKLRSRTNKLPSNWGEEVYCETGCAQFLTNEHILNCIILNEPNYKVQDINLIYNGNIEEKVTILNAFRRNMSQRKKYLPLDSK